MKRLSFSSFTKKEKASLIEHGVLNGHGAANTPVLRWFIALTQPRWLKNASAYHHDFYYTVGRDESDRWQADHQYYLIMLQDANIDQPNDFIYLWRVFRCWIHFKAVRYGGRKSGRFHYANDYRTKEELMSLRFEGHTYMT